MISFAFMTPVPSGITCAGAIEIMFAIALGEGLGQLRVRRVSRLDCDHVTQKSAPGKEEVTNDIENFMTDKFVLIPQRLFTHDRFTAYNDRVLQTSASNQAFVEKRFYILVKNKSPRPCNLPLINLRYDFS